MNPDVAQGSAQPGVYRNPFVEQIAEAYLGSGLQMPFITANTCVSV